MQGLNPSSTCIPLQGERRQDDERRHSDLYSRVNPVICPNLVVLSHLKMVEQRRKTDDERHQALSLVGYEPNHDELCYERKRHVSTPPRKKCGHPAEEREPRREFKASRRRQDRRSSTPQGKDSIEKTTRTVIDTVEEADDSRCVSVLQSSIRSNQNCI